MPRACAMFCLPLSEIIKHQYLTYQSKVTHVAYTGLLTYLLAAVAQAVVLTFDTRCNCCPCCYFNPLTFAALETEANMQMPTLDLLK